MQRKSKTIKQGAGENEEWHQHMERREKTIRKYIR